MSLFRCLTALISLSGYALALELSTGKFESWYGPGPAPWLGGKPQELFSFDKVASAIALVGNASGGIDWVKRGAVTPPISQVRASALESRKASVGPATNALTGCLLDFSQGSLRHLCPILRHGQRRGPVAPRRPSLGPSLGAGDGGLQQLHWAVRNGLGGRAQGPRQSGRLPSREPQRSHAERLRSQCDTVAASKSFATIDGATCLTQRDAHGNADEDQMLAWLQHGPLSISVAAGALGPYKGGIINGSACNNSRVDHAVLVVGAGIDANSGMRYWKLKNSWGPTFGEGGYFRLQHGVHYRCELIFIETYQQ